ncbi:molybdopterin-binding protein [Rugosimonospora africana]|uniref:Molybdopterin-binding protein n=1 Tax=Rugosimonospora africana TaxID=556532 RepID=A0A8J3QR19_9ACTN|nr:molybdopterin-binding protein [Rugosimonospora africana]
MRSERLSSQLGLWLGLAFGMCFVTGYLSHLIQHPPAWFWWPSRPVWLYRVTQGLHVATGMAAVPLLGAKLWSVYPKLFTWPPVRGVVHGLERASVAVLVGSALFQVVTGLLNIARWYTVMPFFFTVAHYWTAWLTIGALLVHIAVQLPVVRRALTRPAGPQPAVEGLSRRGLLAAVGASAGAITLATAGQTVAPLKAVSVLAPRRPDVGPQRLPVNTSARAARVAELATDPGYRLTLTGPAGTRLLSLAELSALPQHTVSLPITCVEGWSAQAQWTGVRVVDLLHLAGATDPDCSVHLRSLQQGSAYGESTLAPPHAHDPLTLIALRLHGQPLALDHGYPARLIAPNRPGALQTKWVAVMTVRQP